MFQMRHDRSVWVSVCQPPSLVVTLFTQNPKVIDRLIKKGDLFTCAGGVVALYS